MKFCDNLLQLIKLSDPEWAPYWVNYMMLKGLIVSELHSCVLLNQRKVSNDAKTTSREEVTESLEEEMFFRSLRGEMKKVSGFFEKAEAIFLIREERLRHGISISKKIENEKTKTGLAKSVIWLYVDLLSLETFAIMTYCAFSKLLKRLDKITGCHRGFAFMSNEVNNANFTSYSRTSQMIKRTNELFEADVEQPFMERKLPLDVDECLFINLIGKLNRNILETDSKAGQSLLMVKRAKMDTAFQKTPMRNDIASKSTFALRYKIKLYEQLKAKEISEFPKKAFECGALVSFAATNLSF